MVVMDWSKFLILPPAEETSEQTTKLVVPSMGAGFEPVGRAFHDFQFVPEVVEGDDEDSSDADFEKKEALRLKLDNKKLDLEDMYALMGLEEFGWKSTKAQIEANWKLISFLCHPDKSTPEDRPWGEKRFKAMQNAYKTLTDKQLRIGYDSSLPFDEAIPKAKEGTTEETFYKVYGPMFERNARFSVNQPCPVLGDKDTSDDDMNAFYDFWLDFKSWRDFTHLDEHKNDDGTDRYTKRENDRKNKKLRAAAKKTEMARVRSLVEGAMKKDPRMNRFVEKQKEEAKRKKAEKKARFAKKPVVNKEEEEKKAKEAAAAAEANAKKEAEDAARKAKSDRNKNNKKFKKLCKSKRGGEYEEADVQKIVDGATHEQIAELITAFSLRAGPGNPPMMPEEVEAAKALFAKVIASC